MPRRRGYYDQNHDLSEHDLLKAWPHGKPARLSYREFMRQMAAYDGWVEGAVNMELFGNWGDCEWFIVNHVDQEVRAYESHSSHYPPSISSKIWRAA